MSERDRAWFIALYERHYADVLRYGYRRVGPDRAADVAADTFLVAWRRLADVPEPPLPWLYGVARTAVAGIRRIQEQNDQDLLCSTATLLDLMGLLPDPTDRTYQALLLADGLAQLSENDQEILQLSAWEGLSIQAIAQVLECSNAAAAVRLHRARRRLAVQLSPTSREFADSPEVVSLALLSPARLATARSTK